MKNMLIIFGLLVLVGLIIFGYLRFVGSKSPSIIDGGYDEEMRSKDQNAPS